MKLRNYSAWLLLLTVAVASCTKSSNNGGRTTASYSISNTGGMYTGETVNFSSTAPSGGTFSWNFGDTSAFSSSHAPGHMYTVAGAYTVTLVYNTTDTIRKTIHIGSDSTNTSRIAGSRYWHHSFHNYVQGTADTTYSRTDTTIPVGFIDPITIAFGNDTLTRYVPSWLSYTGAPLYFNHIFVVTSGGVVGPTGSSSYLYYYPANDSMSYGYDNHISAGSHTDDYYQSP